MLFIVSAALITRNAVLSWVHPVHLQPCAGPSAHSFIPRVYLCDTVGPRGPMRGPRVFIFQGVLSSAFPGLFLAGLTFFPSFCKSE